MSQDNVDVAGKYSTLLAGTELGFGSILHAWHIPMAGHLLSLNQGFILSKASQKSSSPKHSMGARISLLVAVLKSLSPAGKRLTPMLAISAQGFLFSAGQWLFGSGLVGTLIGMILLSLWSFIQPLMFYIAIFGYDIVRVARYFLTEVRSVIPVTETQLLVAFFIFVAIKLTFAIGVGLLSYTKTGDDYELYLKKHLPQLNLQETLPTKSFSNSDKLLIVLKDFLQPWFLLSFLVSSIFFFMSKANQVEFIWHILRPLAIAFIIFYALRFLPLRQWIQTILKGHILEKDFEEMGR